MPTPASVEFYGPAGKPAWVFLKVFDALGSRWTPWLLLAITLIATIRIGIAAHTELIRMGKCCRPCGHPTSGLKALQCPECGAFIQI